jgi:hypothetical protein
MAKNTAKVDLRGLTTALTKVTSSTTTSRVLVCTTGATKEFIKVIGRTTRWKAEDLLNGQMAGSTRDSTSTIKRKDRVLFTGPTVVNTKVRG